MKAVILAGGPGSDRFPLANCVPKLTLPLVTEPLLVHCLHCLRWGGCNEVAITSYNHTVQHQELLTEVRRKDLGIRLTFFPQREPRGTAGSLREIAEWLQEGPFLVLSPGLFLSDLRLQEIVEAHRQRQAGITVVAQRPAGGGVVLENLLVDEDGRVLKCVVLHRSRERRNGKPRESLPPGVHRDRRRPLLTSGLYVFSPSVLEEIPRQGYMDIKEQLLSQLGAKGVPVFAHLLERPLRQVDDLRSYFALDRDLLTGEEEASLEYVYTGKRRIGSGVWAAEGVEIEPGVQIKGPVILGAGCRIGERARIEGPASLAEGVQIGRGAVVEGCILAAGARVGDGASVRRSLVSPGCQVEPEAALADALVMDPAQFRGNQALLHSQREGDLHLTITAWDERRLGYHLIKRVLDVVLSSVLLVLLLPLFALIALAIKLDSRGPVFYVQRRCGRGGREFPLYKFRTMVVNAEQFHSSLLALKEVDGPMFKMRDDPRVTRLGRFLRRSSLDELPQLVNTLKGDMSLVGPRPLVMQEMEFAPHWRDLRLRMRPGITGLWQINGRDSVAFHDWIKNDIQYVNSSSLTMDLHILLRTLKVLKFGSLPDQGILR